MSLYFARFNRCGNLPWHICSLIAEAAGLEPSRFTKAELNQAKQLADVSDSDIRGTVAYMHDVNGGFWGLKKRITPAAVLDNLPLYRKHARSKANGHSSPITEAELIRYAELQEAHRSR